MMDKNGKTDAKTIERRAKSMLLNKDIPKDKMDIIRTIMNNDNITKDERYSAIISLLKNCPDKKIILKKENKRVQPVSRNIRKQADDEINQEAYNYLPTETSYYIDNLIQKYKHTKLFRKRYLAHRNNRFGIGFRKRIIPSPRLIKVLQYLTNIQEKVLPHISLVMSDILNDESIDDPLIFNYLRVMRKWLTNSPLVKYNYSTIKWMERNNFEKEFLDYITFFFSFLKLEIETKEQIIELMENKLRESEELKKDEINIKDSDQLKRTREKKNLGKEKIVHEFLLIIRSFLMSGINDVTALSRQLKNNFNINSLPELLINVSEVLIFQRPITMNEIVKYFNIIPPGVSSSIWDYNEDFLKKIGKDPASLKKKRITETKSKLEPYEIIVKMLKIEKNAHNLVMNGAINQWEFIDKKKYDPKLIIEENYFSFIDGFIQFFKNQFLPLLDGSIVYFNDFDRVEHESSLFDEDYFKEDILSLNLILDELHFFKSNNPTLAIKRNEVKKIMKKQITSMSNVEEFVNMIGNFFYVIAKKLQRVYDSHRQWIYNRSKLTDINHIRKPLKIENTHMAISEMGRPLPFYDCTIKDFFNNNPLSKKITGKKIIDNNLIDGIFVQILAFSYQASYECFNENLYRELDERKNLMKILESIK